MTGQTDIFLAGAEDRATGVSEVLGAFDLSVLTGKDVAIKANFNSADRFPASTDIHTLAAIADAIIDVQPSKLTLAERSGMGMTREILTELGILALAKEREFGVVILDELDRSGWSEVQDASLHWSRGFFLANIFARADHIIQTCCLKTHRYGGHFTCSLKNAVGCIARRVPGLNHDFMNELHGSPRQRSMIAEINRFLQTDLVLMDATEGFSSGGPDKGKLIRPNLIIGGQDRVAIDAVGVALLRSFGTVPDIMNGNIFELEQIRRAVELGIGITSPDQIHLVPLDKTGELATEKIQIQLDADI